MFLLFILSASKLIYNVVRTIFSRNSLKSIASKIEADPDYLRQMDGEIKFEEQELGSAKKQAKLSKKSQGDSKDIIQRILSILQILETEGVTPFARKKIADKLVGIADSEHKIEKRLREIETSANNLKRSDTNHIDQLREQLARAQGKERDRLQRETELENEKLRLSRAVENFGQRINGFLEDFKTALRSAAEIIGRSSYPLDGRPYLQRAIQIEQEIRRELRAIEGLEDEIGKMARMERDTVKHGG